MMGARIGFILAVMFSASSLCAQTTQPSSPLAWPAVVCSAAEALVADDVATFRSLMNEKASIRTFQKDGDVDVTCKAIQGARILGAHAYINPPLVMAADLAADFKNATDLPEEIRKRMLPVDDDDMKRANATAAQWVASALAAHPGEFVAVIVVWKDESVQPVSLTDQAPSQGAVQFVLLKGEEIAPGDFRISLALMGKPFISD